MARPRPIDYRQEMREHDQPQDRSQDWHDLRSDLLDLLNEVDRQEFEHDVDHDAQERRHRAPTARSPRDKFNTPQRDRHRRALNTVAETLERFSDRADSGVSSAIDQIRERHTGIPSHGANRTEDYRGDVREMSARLEKLGQILHSRDTDTSGSQEITNQLAQLTHTVELLAGAVGESGQVKRLESQISGLADVVAHAPERGQTALNQRLDRLAATVEQMADAQYQLADRPVTMIEELSGAQDRGFDAVEAGVRGIYERIDTLEQNIGINPSDIDRLSADMAELVRAVQAGSGDGSLLAKIDALNARMNGIEDTHGVTGALSGDIEALREAVRDAIEPRFYEINNKIETLGGKLKSSNGGQSVELEDHIRQLIARMDQTGSQLSEIAQLQPSSSEGGPDMAALAELIAERTSTAISQSTKSVLADAGSLDERVHKGIQQVDQRLARLEETLNAASAPVRNAASVGAESPNKPSGNAAPEALAPATAPRTQPKNLAQNPKAKSTPQNPEPQPQAPARQADPADTMRANPIDDRPLIDPGFEQPAGDSQKVVVPDMRVESAKTSAPRDPIPRMTPAGFDPSSVEPPRRPRSSFTDDNGSTFSASDNTGRTEQAPPETATNRNTFIEAARRAAQKQNVDTHDDNGSMISRVLAKLRPAAPDEDAVEIADVEREGAQAAPSGLRARLAGFGRKSQNDGADVEAPHREPSYHMDGAYQDTHDEEAEIRASFLSRHRRPLMLAGLVVLVSLLALNLVQRRVNADQAGSGQTPPIQSDTNQAEPAGMLSQPLLDPEPTGSIDPFVRQIQGTGLQDQTMMAPLGSAGATLGTALDVNALKTNAFSPAKPLVDSSNTPSLDTPLKFELPAEAIGPIALREAAAKGDPRAQFEVAAIFSEGRAVPADLAMAAKWYERAAAQGFAPAEYRIGNIYEHGHGVSKNVAQAKIWYERAAEAGNRMSMHNLAAIYASGALGKQQFADAAQWFERAAGLGLTDSQFNLGMLHARGLGVPQDMAISYKWFSLAASRGDDGAAKARDDVARSLDAETISRLRSEIAEWKPLEINLGANFAPIGTWAEDFNPGNTIGDKNVVKEVQGVLNRLGYDVGTPDGLMGPRTRDAIATFERDTGMSESGAVNPRLLAVLGSQPV